MTFVKHVATSNAEGIRSSGVGDTYAQAIERCRGQRRGTHLNADVFVFRSDAPFTDLPTFLDRRATVELSPCGEFAAFTNCEMSRFGR